MTSPAWSASRRNGGIVGSPAIIFSNKGRRRSSMAYLRCRVRRAGVIASGLSLDIYGMALRTMHTHKRLAALCRR